MNANLRNPSAKLLLGCLLTVACALAGRAQSGDQGSIEGTVTDPSGALAPGVTLTVRKAATGAAFTTKSNENGLFRFPVLPAGTYELVAQRSGFATLIQKNVVVTVGGSINLTLSLRIAEKAESVVVSNDIPILETTRTQVSTTVDQRLVSGLPVNGRNFIEFVLLTPGVTRDTRLGDLSIAGQRGTLNSFLVDGMDDNNTFYGQAMGRPASGRAPYQFSQDAVEEFQVNTNSYSAELGRAGSAVINTITKSGTNELHGMAFWYYRDKSMNANDLVNKLNGSPKPPFHFHQFGDVLGGPIVKNKVFFLLDYDGQRSTLQNAVFLNLPASFTLSPDPIVAGFQQRGWPI